MPKAKAGAKRQGRKRAAAKAAPVPVAAGLSAADGGASRGEWIFLGALVAAAFVFRLLMSLRDHDVLWDGYYYGVLGKNLIRGNFSEGMSTYWSPLYPLLVGVSSLFFSDLKFAASFVSVVAGTLTVAAVYFLIRDLYGRAEAGAGAALAAAYPQLVLYSAVFLTEATYTLLFVCGMHAGWLALSRRGGRHFLLAGLAFGACYLVKPEAFAYAGLLTFVAAASAFVARRLLTKETLLNVALVAVGFLVLAAPYVLYLRAQTGRWTLSEKTAMHLHGAVNIYKLTPDGEGTLADRLWVGGRRGESAAGGRRGGSESFARPPAGGQTPSLAARLTTNLPKESRTLLKVVPAPLLALALLGLAAPPWSRARAAREGYILLFLLSTLAGYAVTTSVNEARLLTPLVPAFACWWARAVVIIEAWIARGYSALRGAGEPAARRRAALRAVLVAALCLALVPWSVSVLGRGARSGYGREGVGRWLAENSAGGPLMAAAPWPAFYSGGEHLFLPLEPYPTVIEYARRKGVNFIVIEEDTTSPHMRFLFQPGGEERAAADLAPAYRYDYEGKPGHRIVVYKLTAASP